MKKLTKKQIKTLLLFAQNYSIPVIAKKQKVGIAMIKKRITSIAKNHNKEFENALSIRKANARNRDKLRNIENFSNFNETIFPIQDKF